MEAIIGYSDGRPAKTVDVRFSKIEQHRDTYEVSIDGEPVGWIRKATTSTPVNAAGRRYSIGSLVRTGWVAVGIRYSTPRMTRLDAVAELLSDVRYVRKPVAS